MILTTACSSNHVGSLGWGAVSLNRENLYYIIANGARDDRF